MKDKIPEVLYTPAQHELWRSLYKRLSKLHPQAMCDSYLEKKEKLEQYLNMDEKIPQLGDLSEYLRSMTGFTIKPAYGMLSQREFLNALAFKVFCSTQYLRNVKTPEYSYEPDIIHEIIGHVPMFSDPDIAVISLTMQKLSQTIGILSLGASDQDIAKLGTLYFFIIEFGACKVNNKLKSYGAGLAGSIT